MSSAPITIVAIYFKAIVIVAGNPLASILNGLASQVMPQKTVDTSNEPQKTVDTSNEPQKTVDASNEPQKTVDASNEPQKTVDASNEPEARARLHKTRPPY
ncbi:hypothetical protein MDAP_001184 [Mitosporidium daphniae]